MKVRVTVMGTFRRLFVRWKSRIYQARFVWEVRRIWGGSVALAGCRMNVPVRGTGACGFIQIGNDNNFGYQFAPILGDGRILLQPRGKEARIVIGSHCAFSNNISIIARCEIIIGDKFLCGDRVTIVDSDFHNIRPERRWDDAGETRPVRIGDNVWVGSGATILKGVSIGDHSIVAPGSVVTKDVPARVVVGGVPARIIRAI